DVIVCIDACFQHRRYSSVKEDPEIVSMDGDFFFLSEEVVKATRKHVHKRRETSKSSTRQDAKMPAASLDQCRDSHNAALDKGDSYTEGLFSSKAIMGMVC
ncbi:hypothetical protein M422DRAFT_87271, partial [Sphaerobolus stellatus SS14]